MDLHQEAVVSIAERVKQFYKSGEKFRIYHGHTNSTRTIRRRRENIVDTSRLCNVIQINTESKTALVEPNVCMDKLVESTLAHDLIPQVVPEFRGITVGGAFAGTAGESSSFKYGIFDSTVNRIEIVLADGTITIASDIENADLLYGSAGACGTLGVVTLLEVQLMDAKPFVQLDYYPTESLKDAMLYLNETVIKEEQGNTDVVDSISTSRAYIDGIIFSRTSAVIMAGRFQSFPSSGSKVSRFTRPQDQHFYRHVEKEIARHRGLAFTEAIPIRDYIFRYDRGCFWGAKRAFNYFHVPFNRVTRWILDPFMSSRVMFHAMHESGLADRAIIQDVSFPICKTLDFVKYLDPILGCYPLWLCPLRPTSIAKMQTSGRTFGMGKHAPMDARFCNVGVWIMSPTKTHDDFVKLNRTIEEKTHEIGGLKTLYAHTYYTEDEFWDVYDKKMYDALRVKYKAVTLPNVYEKVKVDLRCPTSKYTDETNVIIKALWMLQTLFWGTWPFSGLYGVWRVIVSKEYLLKEKDP